MAAPVDVAALAALVARDHAAARAPLDRALRALHGSGRSRELCALHRLAARYWAADPAQAAFHRTHAYVYALEAGDARAEADMAAALRAEGRL